MSNQHYDVLIVGAGISGIGMACHLARACPEKSVALIERRQDLGGTWDLFHYPGIRSDSDMCTFGYGFRPWTQPRVLADGPAIKQYVRETAREYGLQDRIHYGLQVRRARWDSAQARWTVSACNEATGGAQHFACRFLVGATGYYRYDDGHKPDFPGEDRFQGQIVHPQHWPEDLDYTGKRVVVIGSGATAITLVPAMADETAHITMLQRSPSFIASLPEVDPMASRLYRWLPDHWVYTLMRKRNIALQSLLYKACRRWPRALRRLLQAGVRRQLGDQVDMRHFQPDYEPWDQRLCIVPDGDLFKALRTGQASVVTDHIEHLTDTGIQLASGGHLEADLIVTATGLEVQALGGMTLEIDGERVDITNRLLYKNALMEGVPNAAVVLGYINAAWTLRVDLMGAYIARLLKHMDAHGHDCVVPRDHEGCKTDESVMDALKAGYARRASDRLPRQGSHGPWRVTHDYRADKPDLLEAPIDDGYLEFSNCSAQADNDAKAA